MKPLLTIIATALIGGQTLMAESIKPMEPTLDDFVPLLEQQGLKMYPFDISQLADQKRIFAFTAKEYENGKLVNENALPMVWGSENITYASDFGEPIPAEECVDPERGIYSLSNKLTIGFVNSTDSTKTMQIGLNNHGMAAFTLAMKPVAQPGDKLVYVYNYRPFKLDEEALTSGKFTPLVLFGSAWYDDHYKVIRFCGENELNASLDDSMVKEIPHFYVIGVTMQTAENNKKN